MATTDSQAALAALPTTKTPHALPINSNASTDFTLSALSDESDNYRPSISLDNNSMHSSSLSPPFSLQDNHHNASQDSFLNQYHEQFEKTPTSALQQQRCSTINKQVHHHHQQHPHDQQINYQNLNSYTFCSVCKKQDEVCDCADQSQDVCNNNNNQWSSRMEDPKNQMLLVDKHQEQYSSSPNVLEAQFKFSSGQQTTQYGYVNQVQLSSSSHSDQQVMISVASGDFPSNDAQLNYNYAQDANNLSNNPVNQDWMLFNNAPNVASTNESYALDEFAPTNSNHTDASQVRQLDHSIKTMDDPNNNSCSRPYAQPDQNSYTHYQQHFEVNSFYQQVNCVDSSDHNHNRYQHYEEGFNKLPPNQLSSVNYENRLNAVETSVVPLFGSAEGADGKEADRSLKSRAVFPSQDCLVESEVGISRSRFVSGLNQQISSDCLNEQARYDNNNHYVITNQPVEVEVASSRQVDQPQQVSGKARSPKGRRGRPRKKGQRSKSKVNGKLWEFIRDLLLSDLTNPNFIRWERREDGVFKFVQSDKVAKMWGERKQNPKMTYEKLSRAMRYYYKTKVLLPVFGRRLVYKFGPNATGWRVNTIDEV